MYPIADMRCTMTAVATAWVHMAGFGNAPIQGHRHEANDALV